mgnify:CR=1 FL=1
MISRQTPLLQPGRAYSTDTPRSHTSTSTSWRQTAPATPGSIFWAIVNHVVRRGHFLMEGHNVSSANSDPSAQVEALVRELDALGEACGEAIELDGGALDGMGGSWTDPRAPKGRVRSPYR